MAVDKEYWNIPKNDELLSIPQGTNLTVFVDHADNSLVWGLGASDVTAIAGVFIALIAIVISIWQVIVSRKHDLISVRPILSYSTFMNDEIGKYVITICNVGGGPAIIKDAAVYFKSKTIVLNNYDKAYNALEKAIFSSFKPEHDIRFSVPPLGKGAVISSGEKISITIEVGKPELVKRDYFSKPLADVLVEIFYTGVYGKSVPSLKFSLGY
uniref:Uncharacterized protein n=1 Tax=viral metagenome TaxID=1070528 RepID=A0A6M3LR80_9ZZZZ